MIPTAVLMKIATLGLSEAQAEAVAGMLKEVEAATQGDADAIIEKGREKVRARVQKWRAKQSVTLPGVTERHVTAHASASPAPDLENKQTNKQENKKTSRASHEAAFRAELASDLPDELLDGIIQVRRDKRGQVTGLAARCFRDDAAECGMSVHDAAKACVTSSWITVKPHYFHSRAGPSGPPRNGDPFAALAEISRAKGWSNEPASLPRNHQNDQRLPPEREERHGAVVDLRRGPGGDFGSSDLRDSPALSPQRNS